MKTIHNNDKSSFIYKGSDKESVNVSKTAEKSNYGMKVLKSWVEKTCESSEVIC